MGILRDTLSGLQQQSFNGSGQSGDTRRGAQGSGLRGTIVGLGQQAMQQRSGRNNISLLSPYIQTYQQSAAPRQEFGEYDYYNSRGGQQDQDQPDYGRDCSPYYGPSGSMDDGNTYRVQYEDDVYRGSRDSVSRKPSDLGALRNVVPPLPPRRPNMMPPAYAQDDALAQRPICQRPVALPQTGLADGSPLLRGYSSDLEAFGIDRYRFISFVDAFNVARTPNPEMQLINKAAGLAGWFVPGAGGIALSAVQIGASMGGAANMQSTLGGCLAKANQELFAPAGLQATLCSTAELEAKIGFYQPMSSQNQNFALDANCIQRVQQYGPLLAPLTTILPPVITQGRNDMSAQLGAGLSRRTQRKAMEKAAEDMAKGKTKNIDKMERKFQWLVIQDMSTAGLPVGLR